MTTSEYATAIQRPRGQIHEIVFPPTPGVYAIYLETGSDIAGIPTAADRLLYIGTSGNLAQLDAETHFQTGKSGFSTLRRTIGALFKRDVGLQAEPRSGGPSSTNITNYRFTEPGETYLTSWMTQHLAIGFVTVSDDVAAVKKRLIRDLQPPLNLTGWDNPHRQRIKLARAACRHEAEEARESNR